MKLELDENSKIEADNISNNTLGLNDTRMINSNKIPNDEVYDNIELKIERDELVAKDDFNSASSNFKNNKIRRYGNTFVCFFNKNGDPKIVIGPHCKKINKFFLYF